MNFTSDTPLQWQLPLIQGRGETYRLSASARQLMSEISSYHPVNLGWTEEHLLWASYIIQSSQNASILPRPRPLPPTLSLTPAQRQEGGNFLKSILFDLHQNHTQGRTNRYTHGKVDKIVGHLESCLRIQKTIAAQRKDRLLYGTKMEGESLRAPSVHFKKSDRRQSSYQVSVSGKTLGLVYSSPVGFWMIGGREDTYPTRYEAALALAGFDVERQQQTD